MLYPMWYGICDCNAFYASCERLFRPDLHGKPVVVLSNNDGIIVALTTEAKALGLKRGDALFKVRPIVEQGKVALFSSNYALYQDISDSVMATLRNLVGTIEQYSIDESFFTTHHAAQPWCEKLRETMVRTTGMPVAIAIARTRTLAKAGENLIKHSAHPALVVTEREEEEILRRTSIGDVWGIGHSGKEALLHKGIKSAYAFAKMDDHQVRRMLGIQGLKTVQELRGKPLISIAEPERKSLACGISFAEAASSPSVLKKAASCHAVMLAEKLSRIHMEAYTVTFGCFTDRFKAGFLSPRGSISLPFPTSYAPEIASACHRIIDRIWQSGSYKGCRIWATDLVHEGVTQLSLFEDESKRKEKRRATHCVEDLHARYGRKRITIASTYLESKDDLMRQSMLSPRYTTRIEDIPWVNISPVTRLFSGST